MMYDPIRMRRAFDVIHVPLRILGWIMPSLYHFNVVSLPVGLCLAATFFGLLVVSGVLAWRSSLLE